MKEKKPTEKICQMCQTFKPVADFGKEKKVKSGLRSYCRECNNLYQTKYNKKNSNYSIKFPELWREYQNEYMRKYKEDPVNKRKNSLCSLIMRWKKKGFIIPENKCCECGQEGHTKAFLSNETVKRYLDHTPAITWLVKAINWTCSGCLGKKRRKYDY